MTFFSQSQTSSLKGQGDDGRLDDEESRKGAAVSVSSESPQRVILYPKCAFCREPIQNIIVQAMDEMWHPEHFCCAHCQIPISTQKFHVHEGRPYCVEDYAALFLKKCHGCRLPIQDVVVVALEQTWHPDHFVCVSCGTKLLQRGFYEKEGNAFCEECYEGKFCPKCAECGEPITDTAIKIRGQRWHEACFKCGRCGRPIRGHTFRVCGQEVLCGGCGGRSPSEEGSDDVMRCFDGSGDEEERGGEIPGYFKNY